MKRKLRGGGGRGAGGNPPNRFERLHLEPLPSGEADAGERSETRFFRDSSRSILAKNESPDLPFRYSINPYRGCEHGCIYCYARPSHEYLGFSSGLDFETRIMVKPDAPRLLAETFRSTRWTAQTVALSGNTDCYQPAERTLNLTRRCLQVFLAYRNPVSVVTKNVLIIRDIDILQEMAKLGIVHVTVSVTTLDAELARRMEPRTASPLKRLETIRNLAECDIPVGVNLAPVIPGLTDEEIPEILRASSEAGAGTAGFLMLRLPGTVRDLFLEWMERTLPERAGKIRSRILDIRGGAMNDSRFGTRGTGEGESARTIGALFEVSARKHGLRTGWDPLATHHFRREPSGRLALFD
jgi:DNA repair photolyase